MEIVMNEVMDARAYSEKAQMAGISRKVDITIGENLDEQITYAEKRLADLIATKKRLETTGLLTSRIDDLRQAMNY
jgi:hypothetical protein